MDVCMSPEGGGSIMVGAWPLWLLQRCRIPFPTESSVNPHISFPCPNRQAYSLLSKWMHEDICLEFLALSEVRWSLYGMVMFICDRAFLCIPSQRSSNSFLTTQYIYIYSLHFWSYALDLGNWKKWIRKANRKRKEGQRVWKEVFNLSWRWCVDMHAETWRALPLCRETPNRCRFQEVFHNFCSVQLVSTDPHLSPCLSELSVFCASGQLYR